MEGAPGGHLHTAVNVFVEWLSKVGLAWPNNRLAGRPPLAAYARAPLPPLPPPTPPEHCKRVFVPRTRSACLPHQHGATRQRTGGLG